MLDENLIATLEQSLRQTKAAQNRLLTRLNEVEAEADRLKEEIEALQNSAVQTEAAIYSLLATMGAGKISWNKQKTPRIEDEYEEIRRPMRNNQPPAHQGQQNHQPNHQQNQHQQQPTHQPTHQQQQPPPRGNQNNYQQNNYQQGGSVAYLHHQRNVSNNNQPIEAISNRFGDRTITQACTLLLKEAGKSLHVNELYHLLMAGGMEFKGNNPTISIAVSLNRNRRFRKVAPGTFDLVIREASQAVS